MADALSAVKKDLGRNAVILHTRQVKSGGFLGMKRRTLVEITASDSPPKGNRVTGEKVEVKAPRRASAMERTPERATAGMAALSAVSADAVMAPLAASAYRKAAESRQAGKQNISAPAAPIERPVVVPAPMPSRETAVRAATVPAPEVAPSSVVMTVRQRREVDVGQEMSAEKSVDRADGRRTGGLSGPSGVGHDRLFAELADIKLLVNQVLQTTPPTGASGGAVGGAGGAAGSMPEALFRHYLRLLEATVSRDIADGIVGAVRDELSPAEMCDEEIVRTTVLRHLAAMIPVAEHVGRASKNDGRAFTIALVGPTGVGKTTTIAKLAAAYKLRQGRSVALITSDTYRIAAVDQLRTYASILGVPLKVVATPAEMDAAVRSLSNFDVVLIDSAGRSQNAQDRLKELSAFLEAAQAHETHLVLSSTASESVLIKTAQSFADAGVVPNRLILSKLDEAVNFGVVVNVAKRLSAKLSFVTTGQEVPDHIEAGRPDRLARMILDNSLGLAGSSGSGGAGHGGESAGAARGARASQHVGSERRERAELLGIGADEGAE